MQDTVLVPSEIDRPLCLPVNTPTTPILPTAVYKIYKASLTLLLFHSCQASTTAFQAESMAGNITMTSSELMDKLLGNIDARVRPNAYGKPSLICSIYII